MASAHVDAPRVVFCLVLALATSACGTTGFDSGRAGQPADLVAAAAMALFAAHQPDPEHVVQPPIEAAVVGMHEVPRFWCTTASGVSDVVCAEDASDARATCEQLGDEACVCVLDERPADTAGGEDAVLSPSLRVPGDAP